MAKANCSVLSTNQVNILLFVVIGIFYEELIFKTKEESLNLKEDFILILAETFCNKNEK